MVEIDRFIELVKRMITLCRELDVELDGVRLPASACAIINGLRSTLDQLEDWESSDV